MYSVIENKQHIDSEIAASVAKHQNSEHKEQIDSDTADQTLVHDITSCTMTQNICNCVDA